MLSEQALTLARDSYVATLPRGTYVCLAGPGAVIEGERTWNVTASQLIFGITNTATTGSLPDGSTLIYLERKLRWIGSAQIATTVANIKNGEGIGGRRVIVTDADPRYPVPYSAADVTKVTYFGYAFPNTGNQVWLDLTNDPYA